MSAVSCLLATVRTIQPLHLIPRNMQRADERDTCLATKHTGSGMHKRQRLPILWSLGIRALARGGRHTHRLSGIDCTASTVQHPLPPAPISLLCTCFLRSPRFHCPLLPPNLAGLSLRRAAAAPPSPCPFVAQPRRLESRPVMARSHPLRVSRGQRAPARVKSPDVKSPGVRKSATHKHSDR